MVFIAAFENEDQKDQDYILDIYEQYKNMMLNTAKKYTSNYWAAEDIVQDSIVKLIPKVSTMRKLSGCTLGAYVVYTVRNTAKNYLRSQDVKNKHTFNIPEEDYDTNFYSLEPSPEELLLTSERVEAFKRIWHELSEEDQLLLMGKYILDLNNDDLAIQIECKSSSIRMKLTRARRRAIKLMNDEEFSYDKK